MKNKLSVLYMNLLFLIFRSLFPRFKVSLSKYLWPSRQYRICHIGNWPFTLLKIQVLFYSLLINIKQLPYHYIFLQSLYYSYSSWLYFKNKEQLLLCFGLFKEHASFVCFEFICHILYFHLKLICHLNCSLDTYWTFIVNFYIMY